MDRLLGELGIPQDSAAGREQLERHLETRRAQENSDEFKPIRRGWCLGGETFRAELLAAAHGRAGERHHAQTRRETTEQRARRIVQEELDKLGWPRAELRGRAKGDARKVRIAQRLRAEPAVTLKWIAQALQMGTWTHVANRLQNAKKGKPTDDQHELGLV